MQTDFATIRSDAAFLAFLNEIGMPVGNCVDRDLSSFWPYLFGPLTNEQTNLAEAYFKQQGDEIARCTLPDSGRNSNYQRQFGAVWVTFFPYACQLSASLHKEQTRP